MKTSIVLSISSTKFSALAFKGDLNKHIRHISNLGFDGVELAIRDPNFLNQDRLKKLLDAYGLALCAIGTGQAYIEEHLSFTATSKHIRKKAIDRIKSQIEFAKRFGALVILGLVRGNIPVSIKREAEIWAKEAFIECAEYAKEHNVILAIEPLNRYETNFLNTVEQTITFLKEINCSNLSILIDTFHMNIEEVSIPNSIYQSKDYISHIHFADSNRWAPGCGHINFNEIIDTLFQIEYLGFISAEILPFPNPEMAAGAAIKKMQQLITDGSKSIKQN